MGILTFLVLLIIGSVVAAAGGDWSGISAIGMFLFYAAVFVVTLYIIATPALMWLLIGVAVIAFLIYLFK